MEVGFIFQGYNFDRKYDLSKGLAFNLLLAWGCIRMTAYWFQSQAPSPSLHQSRKSLGDRSVIIEVIPKKNTRIKNRPHTQISSLVSILCDLDLCKAEKKEILIENPIRNQIGSHLLERLLILVFQHPASTKDSIAEYNIKW